MSHPETNKEEIVEDPPRVPGELDKRVTIRNAKTGQVIRVTPHRVRCVGQYRYFEKPSNSGNLFFESGEVAGRWVDGKVDPHAEHVEYVRVTPQSYEEVAKKNAALEAEVRALRAEQAAKLKGQGPATQGKKEA